MYLACGYESPAAWRHRRVAHVLYAAIGAGMLEAVPTAQVEETAGPPVSGPAPPGMQRFEVEGQAGDSADSEYDFYNFEGRGFDDGVGPDLNGLPSESRRSTRQAVPALDQPASPPLIPYRSAGMVVYFSP
ncbi:hypothetical protein CLV47_12314 [Antricoccus suffuscus]|uniref:Uncharacterized protein n=1 Tax=Antricoccus suffuscus TaxID=1629062 RepID=A0A2T0ZEJ8_9ACTN|nr:hypothetical protein [Antricoccus suffuscus]PRZ34782.1 hypothetical protein CLV47_12314 [Antricoccus suffuscus]